MTSPSAPRSAPKRLPPAAAHVPTKDWTMVIGFRAYRPGSGCIPALSDKRSKHHVMHCDILLKRPCGERWCGVCVRAPEEDPCPNCVPCHYRQRAAIPGQSKMSPEQLRCARNLAHSDDRKSHVVTYTAREDGVVCLLDRNFECTTADGITALAYNWFYRVNVDELRVLVVEEFFINQLRQPYNWEGFYLNFLCCFRWWGCPRGTLWSHLDSDAKDPRDEKQLSQRKWFCSEIVVTALALAHAEGFTRATGRSRRQEPCAFTPDEVAQVVMSSEYAAAYSPISKDDVMLERQES